MACSRATHLVVGRFLCQFWGETSFLVRRLHGGRKADDKQAQIAAIERGSSTGESRGDQTAEMKLSRCEFRSSSSWLMMADGVVVMVMMVVVVTRL